MGELRPRVGLAAFLVLAAAMVVGGSSALAVSGAVSTTDNPGFPDPGALNGNGSDAQCLNGQGVNCNIYTDKTDVWFSGLPIQASLGAGTYFFSVQVPGGQPDPNDGGTKNLSDLSPTSGTGAGDTWGNRVFSVDANGLLS